MKSLDGIRVNKILFCLGDVNIAMNWILDLPPISLQWEQLSFALKS
jgi:hypothetical protein